MKTILFIHQENEENLLPPAKNKAAHTTQSGAALHKD